MTKRKLSAKERARDECLCPACLQKKLGPDAYQARVAAESKAACEKLLRCMNRLNALPDACLSASIDFLGSVIDGLVSDHGADALLIRQNIDDMLDAHPALQVCDACRATASGAVVDDGETTH